MGEVWKAIDPALDREIAIKVLPAEFASDADRLARFEREAKLLASLSHPNIATIHGLHEAEGVRFLAMELVRGEDFAQILSHGPLPIRDVLDAARQMAAALEAAHDSGVIHRDLKPANLKRTPEGQVKVLDFGLAKALETAVPASGQSATVTSAGTRVGIILGTASYMSPEQARGLGVDRRTDLWAFGCVLYEMLAGTKAFDGPTVTDVLAAVVTGDPDWSKLPPATPVPVRRLLRRCLEKDVRKRLRDAGDASLLLEENPEDGKTGPIPARAARPARSWALPAVALIAALGGLGVGWWAAHRGPTGTETSVAFHRLTYARGMVRTGRFAPDGRTIVFGGAWGGPPTKLYMARTDSPESTPIAAPEAELFSISKNGEMAVGLGLRYYGWMGLGTLARLPLLGGSPREIAENVRSADWSPDGTQFAIVRRTEGLDQIEYPIGTVLAKTSGFFEQVRISPDGERVAFADHPSWGDNLGHLSVVDRAGKKTELAKDFAAIQGVAWASGGREIWFSAIGKDAAGGVYAVDLDGRLRRMYSGPGFYEVLDIAPDGRVLVASHRPERDAQALLAGDSEPRPLVVPGETSLVRTISRDGHSVLVTNQLAPDYETFVITADRPGASRLTGGEGNMISPDGTQAIIASAKFDEFSVVPLGLGPTRKIPNPDGLRYESLAAWLPDGKHFVVAGRKGDVSRGYVCAVDGGAAVPFTADGAAWSFFTPPPVSPDGRYAILMDAAGTPKRWPIAAGEPLPVPGVLPDDHLISWTDDGASLFVAGRTLPIPISRLDLTTGQRTPVMTLSPTDSAGLRFATAVITPNGKYWALGVAKLLSDLYVVEGLR